MKFQFQFAQICQRLPDISAVEFIDLQWSTNHGFEHGFKHAAGNSHSPKAWKCW